MAVTPFCFTPKGTIGLCQHSPVFREGFNLLFTRHSFYKVQGNVGETRKKRMAFRKEGRRKTVIVRLVISPFISIPSEVQFHLNRLKPSSNWNLFYIRKDFTIFIENVLPQKIIFFLFFFYNVIKVQTYNIIYVLRIFINFFLLPIKS